jgi:hypothetical protein
LLLRQAVNDEAAYVRIQALNLVTGLGDADTDLVRAVYSGEWLGHMSMVVWNLAFALSDEHASPDVISVLEAVAVNDPASDVRTAAILAVYHNRAASTTVEDVLESRLAQDSASGVRAVALLCLAGAVFQNLFFLQAPAEALSLPGRLFHDESLTQLPLELPRSDVGERSLTTFERAAESDADAGIRAAATLAIACLRHDKDILVWLGERIRSEPNPTVRSFLEDYMDRSE